MKKVKRCLFGLPCYEADVSISGQFCTCLPLEETYPGQVVWPSSPVHSVSLAGAGCLKVPFCLPQSSAYMLLVPHQVLLDPLAIPSKFAPAMSMHYPAGLNLIVWSLDTLVSTSFKASKTEQHFTCFQTRFPL